MESWDRPAMRIVLRPHSISVEQEKRESELAPLTSKARSGVRKMVCVVNCYFFHILQSK